MTANPFAGGQVPGRKPPSTEDSLLDYAEQLNRQNWVIASGKPYSVRKRELDGKIVAFLDRLG